MTDKEKVIKGLECCATNRLRREDCEAMKCTYLALEGHGCIHQLIRDAFALLKAQEPQVMSIGDLYGYDMGFYERRDEEIVWPVLISRGGPDGDETIGFVRKDGYELRSDCGLMNITWRIWTAYPPHELREATPWQ